MEDLIDGKHSSIENAIIYFETHLTPWAIIVDKDSFSALENAKSYYFAIEEDSFLFVDNVAIPLRNGSKLKEGFNYVYDFETMFHNLFFIQFIFAVFLNYKLMDFLCIGNEQYFTNIMDLMTKLIAFLIMNTFKRIIH